MHRWVRAFLGGRTQSVRVGKEYSSKAEVLSSISQGSIVGRVLFTAFINDLPDGLASTCCKIFVKDTKVYGPTTDNLVLQGDLGMLQRWSKH